jgi:putative transposase
MKPQLGDEALRRFRISQPHSDYFITCCTREKQSGLTSPLVAGALLTTLSHIETDGHWTIRGAVIMADHLHLLVTLHDRLALSRILARFKSKTKPALITGGLQWQGNYYEHHLRQSDAAEDVLLYIFLNPYRAGLVANTEVYPWFRVGTKDASWFSPRLDDRRPFAEWLD